MISAATRRMRRVGAPARDGHRGDGARLRGGRRDIAAGWVRRRSSTPANALTALRIVLVPVFVALTVASEMTDPTLRIAACITFFVASVTDLVDGWIARTWDLVTSFGKVADPIADKALTGSAFVLLSAYGALPWWVTIVILGPRARRHRAAVLGDPARRDRGQPRRQGQDRAADARDRLVPAALPHAGWPHVGPWLMGAALIVTVVTGVDYVRARAAAAPVP